MQERTKLRLIQAVSKAIHEIAYDEKPDYEFLAVLNETMQMAMARTVSENYTS